MPLWLSRDPLVLASSSAARRAMLEAAGIPIQIVIADIDERGIESRAAPTSATEAAQLLAREKAKAVATKLPGRYVVGADQTLALGRARFTKPADRAAAYEQLRTLSGRTHELHSAVAVGRDGRIIFTHVDVARLSMRTLSDRFLDAYLAAVGTTAGHSVGGYQLERIGAQLFERIEGDYFTILGLPLLPLLTFLRREGCLAA
jgi:septum formation protein